MFFEDGSDNLATLYRTAYTPIVYDFNWVDKPHPWNKYAVFDVVRSQDVVVSPAVEYGSLWCSPGLGVAVHALPALLTDIE